jgi:hypothetical protein
MIVLYILGGLVLLIVVLMFIAPKEAKVERSVTVKISQEAAFNHLRSLVNFDQWSPWADRDPNQQRGYKGTEGEVGSIAWWKGNKDVGEGEQEVMKLEPNGYIETELRFLKPFKAINKAYWRIEPTDGGTKVTWGFHGKFTMPMNIMFLFMSMEGPIGKDFEQGMARWKAVVEA